MFTVNNKIKACITIAMISISLSSNAAFSLNGTRYVYEGGKKSLSVMVSNESEQKYAGQVWIDNDNAKDKNVYFTTSPTFFKVDPKSKQTIRILDINPDLPQDRETLTWLNVQEIPPAPKAGGNVLAIALNTRVKLIYRPQTLADGRKEAERKIRLLKNNGKYFLENPTPYYFAITGIKVNGTEVKLNKKEGPQLAKFAPFSNVQISNALNGNVTINTIDDYGANNEYQVSK
ncbi:fimbrial chaperone [Salmonella bongori]|uniref:fimbrial chaperone n=1 Tax=Salmonella bongori TaxID=54736 RepID=UPI00126CF3BA|nr:fimbrial chaperone [Salmonella bongori]ECG8258428.1 fimbrial chaperone [Salmonella bongori serovar 48:i:-]ECG9253663.1 fimbrial chaperone [Salmonella bongori]EDP8707296.1 fimbrial chaperone [Salmonella bongori]EDP8724775.1 fimbrial chaperone [Salmonella bongori]EEO9369305.1 fimbrial chaperone [Salmonella bongori]